MAWKFWTAPDVHAPVLNRLQGFMCAVTGRRLPAKAEVDHRVPLFRVWRDHRAEPWPDLLRYWGLPNLQVITPGAHLAKSAAEAEGRVGQPRPARQAAGST